MMLEPTDLAGSCPFCGSRTTVEVVRETMDYATPKGAVELVVDVPYEVCASCGFRGYGEAGERARTEAIYRYHHRLEPWVIAGIRQRLEMTQKAFAEFIGVGHASVERWEAGISMQSQSMDNLILLLSEPTHKAWLDRKRRERERQSLRQQTLVSLDRFRGLTERDAAALREPARRFRLRQ